MKLTPRLQAVAGMVPARTVVADIGTDHAYIPIYLHLNKHSSRIIATDSKPGPLAAARHTLELFNLARSVDLRSGWGLSPLNHADGVQTVIIAGMGGDTICKILDQGHSRLTQDTMLILQPMTGSDMVRQWLAKHKFSFVDEDLAQEADIIYEIISARIGERAKEYSAAQLAVGPLLIENKHPLLADLLRQRLNILRRAAKGALRSSTPRAATRLRELQKTISRLEEVLSWL